MSIFHIEPLAYNIMLLKIITYTKYSAYSDCTNKRLN